MTEICALVPTSGQIPHKSQRRSLTLLNELGDVTLTWEEGDDDAMLPVIKNLMDRGVTFFRLKPGMIMTRRTKLKSLDDIRDRKLEFANKNFEKVFFNGSVEMRRRESGKIETIGTIKTAEDVVKSPATAATRALKGG